MNQNELTERIITEFGCRRSEARPVAEKAVMLKKRVESDTDWDGLEINTEYIISRLYMAPGHVSVTGKWNWWAGMMGFFDGTPHDYRIK